MKSKLIKTKVEETAAEPSSLSVKKLSELTPDSRNANAGSERGNQMIQDSLRDYGAGRSILLDKHGRVIAGNKTRENAMLVGMDDVIVVQTRGDQVVAVQRMDLDLEEDSKAKALAIADNRSSEVSLNWDIEVLKGLQAEGVPLEQFWEPSELVSFFAGKGELIGDEDDVPPVPDDLKTKLGDVYRLGVHRLMCGDSTKREDVERLMDGQKAALFATDPPYGVAYNDETGDKGSKFGTIANDENNGPQLQQFLENVFRSWAPMLRKDAAWYLWHAQMTQGFFAAAAAAAAADILIHRQIIWVKPSLVLGHGDYHWRHELCFYGWRQGHRAKWYGDRSQTTVWEVGRENDHIHPTQKPVALFENPMEFHTTPGEVCAEPFGGSGSQIIAAEKTGRRCFTMELSPAYCDVIVSRWENATGRKAVLDV